MPAKLRAFSSRCAPAGKARIWLSWVSGSTSITRSKTFRQDCESGQFRWQSPWIGTWIASGSRSRSCVILIDDMKNASERRFEKFKSAINVPASFPHRSIFMSQHRSLKGSSTIAAKRNVVKRFERVELLKKRQNQAGSIGLARKSDQ